MSCGHIKGIISCENSNNITSGGDYCALKTRDDGKMVVQ